MCLIVFVLRSSTKHTPINVGVWLRKVMNNTRIPYKIWSQIIGDWIALVCRSDKCGKILAKALLKGAQGCRYISFLCSFYFVIAFLVNMKHMEFLFFGSSVYMLKFIVGGRLFLQVVSLLMFMAGQWHLWVSHWVRVLSFHAWKSWQRKEILVIHHYKFFRWSIG